MPAAVADIAEPTLRGNEHFVSGDGQGGAVPEVDLEVDLEVRPNRTGMTQAEINARRPKLSEVIGLFEQALDAGKIDRAKAQPFAQGLRELAELVELDVPAFLDDVAASTAAEKEQQARLEYQNGTPLDEVYRLAEELPASEDDSDAPKGFAVGSEWVFNGRKVAIETEPYELYGGWWQDGTDEFGEDYTVDARKAKQRREWREAKRKSLDENGNLPMPGSTDEGEAGDVEEEQWPPAWKLRRNEFVDFMRGEGGEASTSRDSDDLKRYFARYRSYAEAGGYPHLSKGTKVARKDLAAMHRTAVENALDAGEEVPARVLADYDALGPQETEKKMVGVAAKINVEEYTVQPSGQKKIGVRSPYNKAFVKEARDLNGTWNQGKKVWLFDSRDEDRIREILFNVYGTDGSPVEVIDLCYTMTSNPGSREVNVLGRQILKKWSRDERPKLGEGVVIVEGSLQSRGGSRKYPRITLGKTPLVLEIRDVPVSIAEPAIEAGTVSPAPCEVRTFETEGEGQAPAPSEWGEAVIEIPTDELHTDEKRFQPRGDAFSEETARRVAENFDAQLFEPIRAWRDSEDDRWYVLAGHSRLEGMRRRDAETIPVRSFEGTEEEAIRFALTENDKGDSLTNAERATYIRRLRAQEYTKKEQKEEADRLYGRDAATVIALSYLNPEGKALDVLSRFEGNALGEANDAETMAVWIGKLRRYHTEESPGVELTDSHEREVYDWLSQNYKTQGRQLSNFIEFREYVEKVIERRTVFGEIDSPLNFADVPAKSMQEQRIDRQLKEARQQLSKDERALSKQRKEYADQDLTEEEWKRVLGDYEEDVLFSQRRVVELEQAAGAGRRELKRSEMSLFDAMRTNAMRTNPERLWPAKELAARIGVRAASLNEAARKGWRCDGYPVSEWAVRYEGSGRLKGYRVPAGALSARENPEGADAGWPELDACAIVTENESRGGLEIRFPEDPGEGVLEVVRDAGFFFYTPTDAPAFWAAKATPERRLVAAALDKTDTIMARENPEGFRGFGPMVFLGYSEIVTTSAGTFAPEPGAELDFLFTTPEGDALLVVPAEYVETGEGLVESDAAEAMYETWSGFEADGTDYRISFESEDLLPAGYAQRILYRSDRIVREGDREGDAHRYDHRFDPGKRPATLFGPTLLIGNLKITRRGIMN